MQVIRMRYNKRFALVGLCLLVVYVLLSNGYNEYEIDAVIKTARPETVWEFVADFSKMKMLNPTILDFKITSDTGNNDHWKYSVLYTEKLSHWPYWKNVATGDYDVKRSSHSKDAIFTVESKHSTCFFGGLYCLHSLGEFRFTAVNDDTYCTEKIQYQCPPFMKSFCRREVEFQRKAIIYNLTTHFNKTA